MLQPDWRKWLLAQTSDHPLAALTVTIVFIFVVSIAVPIARAIWPKLLQACEVRLIHATAHYWFRRKYLRKIGDATQFPIHQKGGTRYSALPLPLSRIFVPLQLTLRDSWASPTSLLRERRHRDTGWSVWDLLGWSDIRYRCLAIIGPPGSGKTTLLRHVANAAALASRKKRNGPTRSFLPVLVNLKDYASAVSTGDLPTLENLIHSCIEKTLGLECPPKWLARTLEADETLVLLDGLDEIGDTAERRTVTSWLSTQMQKHGRVKFIVTSRPGPYRECPLVNVAELEVQPLDRDDVGQFVGDWYKAATNAAQNGNPSTFKKAESDAVDLLRQIDGSSALTHLAVNPLLLQIIITVHRYRSNDLPEERVELYSEICDVLLNSRRSDIAGQVALSAAHLRPVLESLALHMMERRLRSIAIEEASATIRTTLIDIGYGAHPETCLASIENETGLIQRDGERHYGFSHTTFQEYLAACACRSDNGASLVSHINDDWWQETIRLYAAQADASAILLACIESEPQTRAKLSLAYDCLVEAKHLDKEVRAQVERLLLGGLDSTEKDRFRLAAEVLLEHRLRELQGGVRSIEVSRTYLTNAEYRLFLLDSGHWARHRLQPRGWSNGCFSSGTALHPVRGIDAASAEQFCWWMTSKKLFGALVRLPTVPEARAPLDEVTPRVPLERDFAVAGWQKDSSLSRWHGPGAGIVRHNHEKAFRRALRLHGAIGGDALPTHSIRDLQSLVSQVAQEAFTTELLKATFDHSSILVLNILLVSAKQRLCSNVVKPLRDPTEDTDAAIDAIVTLARRHADSPGKELRDCAELAVKLLSELAHSLPVARVLAHARSSNLVETIEELLLGLELHLREILRLVTSLQETMQKLDREQNRTLVFHDASMVMVLMRYTQYAIDQLRNTKRSRVFDTARLIAFAHDGCFALAHRLVHAAADSAPGDVLDFEPLRALENVFFRYALHQERLQSLPGSLVVPLLVLGLSDAPQTRELGVVFAQSLVANMAAKTKSALIKSTLMDIVATLAAAEHSDLGLMPPLGGIRLVKDGPTQKVS